MKRQFLLVALALCTTVIAQTKDAYETDNSAASKNGLLDPSHFSVHNSIGFGMSSSSGSSNLQSQSLYSTMLQYRFNAPVTVSLNFGLPIHSTISSAQNLNSNNLQSMEYFKNMPLSASFTWQPTDKMIFQLNVERNTYSNLFFDYYHPFDYSRSFFQQPSTVTESRNTEKNK